MGGRRAKRRAPAVLCLLALAGAARAHAAEAPPEPRTVAEWAAAYDALELAGPGEDAAGRRIEAGGLRLALNSGRLYPVHAGGVLAGVFFTGSGSFRHVSADPFEQRIRARAVADASDYTVAADGSFGDTLATALVLVSPGSEALLGLGGVPSGDPAPPPPDADPARVRREAEARTLFTRHVERWRKDLGMRYPVRMAQARLEQPAAPVVVAEMGAAKHDVVFTHDAAFDGDEWIGVVLPTHSDLPGIKGRRYPSPLSVVVTRADRLDPAPIQYLLRDLDVDLRNPEGARAELQVREEIEAVTPLRVVAANLWTRRIGEVGLTARAAELPYKLTRVLDGEGRPLPFVHREEDVLVELKTPLAPGERAVLRFFIEGDVLYRPSRDSYWVITGNWYPSPHRMRAEAYRYHATVRVKKPFVPFSSGRLVRRFEEGDLAGAEFLEEKPIQYAAVLAGKYATYEETRKGLTVRVSSYAFNKTDAMKRLASLAFTYIALYEPLLGPYPFPELQVIEINSFGFGIAPPGLIFITRESFNPADARTHGVELDFDARFIHELAHAWWGHVAKLSHDEELWLCESTTDYMARHVIGIDKGKRAFGDGLAVWRAGALRVEGRYSVFLAQFANGDEGDLDRRRLLYQSGPFVLHALRQEIGDEAFFALLRTYLEQQAMKPASTKAFVTLASELAGRDLRPWFDRYLFGTELPRP